MRFRRRIRDRGVRLVSADTWQPFCDGFHGRTCYGIIMPHPEKPLIERAFEIARSGAVTNVEAIDRKLSEEGYANPRVQLAGRFIRKQLREVIAASRWQDLV